jgi:Rad3-related DNA helicase
MRIIEIQPTGNRDEDQRLTALAILEAIKTYRFVLLDAQTGSGKTRLCGLIQQLSGKKITALVNTISNQNNYIAEGFSLIKGGSNYPCELLGEKADQCPYQPRRDCPEVHVCVLEKAANAFKYSQKGVANYAYFLTRGFSVPEPTDENSTQTEILFLDEAHTLLPVLTNQTECEFSFADLEELGVLWQLIRSKGDNGYEFLKDGMREGLIKKEAELKDMRKERGLQARFNPSVGKPSGKERHLNNLVMRAGKMLNQVAPVFMEWRDTGVFTKSLVPMPLDTILAKYDVPIILATGTFGDYATYAKLLDIENACVIKYPYRFTVQDCKVEIIYSGEITFKSAADDLVKQAKCIASHVDNFVTGKPEAHGLILVNSYSQAEALAFKLNNESCSPMWYEAQPRGKTSEQVIDWWNTRMADNNYICLISPSLWEGYDGNQESFCILAKLPFPNTKDPYTAKRMKNSFTAFSFEIALQVEQGAGRIRRGKSEHYADNKRVWIADGAILKEQYKKHFSQFFKECIKWQI